MQENEEVSELRYDHYNTHMILDLRFYAHNKKLHFHHYTIAVHTS